MRKLSDCHIPDADGVLWQQVDIPSALVHLGERSYGRPPGGPRLASGPANAMANADAQPAGLCGPRGPRLPGVIERAPRVVAGLTEERNQLAPAAGCCGTLIPAACPTLAQLAWLAWLACSAASQLAPAVVGPRPRPILGPTDWSRLEPVERTSHGATAALRDAALPALPCGRAQTTPAAKLAESIKFSLRPSAPHSKEQSTWEARPGEARRGGLLADWRQRR